MAQIQMKGWLVLALLLTIRCTDGEVPRIFEEKDFTAASLAEAVNYFIKLGEDKAVEELNGLVDPSGLGRKNGFSVNERVGWICRVLFVSKPNTQLRPPRFGGLYLPTLTMPADRWPLYPIALSGSTYFVLSEGYSLGGMAENPKSYIQYCRQTGTSRKELIRVPSRAQALKDSVTLRESEPWKMIKWSDSGPGRSYTMDEGYAFRFIGKQAEATP